MAMIETKVLSFSVDIYDCFEDPILARAELFKPLSLIDLGQMSEEARRSRSHGTIAQTESSKHLFEVNS